ncbi:sulfotransferase [Acidithiobacillus ferrianus]|uniref:Sulfotransferase n=2 Tax=Acidithiobacillus ferrianus TaxID=2678518 RepID=A0A845UPX9_9PROT|nr:sulfotransferase [Acidithiobacillus ferrianus]NDU43588.1 sulfotransferase [Acidithiobacillus ferrianus]
MPQQSDAPSDQARATVWPNFFIVGTVKGGTTSLYNHLKQHPEVFLPAFKEPHYFAQIHPKPGQAHLLEYVSDQSDYLKLYHGADDFRAVGDASTSSLWDREAPMRIHAVSPDARIIILLRDPVVRAHSHYLMDFREGVVDIPLNIELLKRDFAQVEKGWGVSRLYVDLGLYHDQVQRYCAIFGRSQVLVLLFDNLVRNPETAFQRVATHLGIDPAPFSQMNLAQVHNGYKAPRGTWARRCAANPLARWIGYRLMPRALQWWLYQHLILKTAAKPMLDTTVRKFLEDIYEPDIQRLESLLEIPLPELRSSW